METVQLDLSNPPFDRQDFLQLSPGPPAASIANVGDIVLLRNIRVPWDERNLKRKRLHCMAVGETVLLDEC